MWLTIIKNYLFVHCILLKVIITTRVGIFFYETQFFFKFVLQILLCSLVILLIYMQEKES